MKNKKAYLTVILLLMILGFLYYPLWVVGKTKEKIDTSFLEGNYLEALQVSESQLSETYSTYTSTMIGELWGFTPRFFFLSVTGICQYQLREYEEAVSTLTQAITYAEKNSYDTSHIEKTKELLKKAKVKLPKQNK